MNRTTKWTLAVVTLALFFSALAGYWAASMSLHPVRRAIPAELIAQADEVFQRDHAERASFDVRAPDGDLLCADGSTNKLRAHLPNRHRIRLTKSDTNDWILLFHGVADNRVGDLERGGFSFARRLRSGDDGFARPRHKRRRHFATYGWKERDDVRAIVTALENKVHPQCIFAFGVSMGGGIALQAAAVEPGLSAVAAEAPFSSFREASFTTMQDFHRNPQARTHTFPHGRRRRFSSHQENGGVLSLRCFTGKIRGPAPVPNSAYQRWR